MGEILLKKERDVMERMVVKAVEREKTGKGVARSLRRENKIPAVLYGKDCPSKAISVEGRELKKNLNRNVIMDLSIGEKRSWTVIIKDVQRDVLKGDLLHVDFMEISLDEKINAMVPISIEGTAPGMREGGVLQQMMREIEIQCLPTYIPEHIVVDISSLGVNESLTLEELELPEKVELLSSPHEVVVTIVVPTEEQEEKELEEEAIQPAVIGEQLDVEDEE